MIPEEIIRKTIIIKTDLRNPKITKKYEILKKNLSRADGINTKISLFSGTDENPDEKSLEDARKEQIMSLNFQEVDEQFENLLCSQLTVVN